MLERENNLILIVILFFVSLVLISAFVIEYGLGHQPCNLCLYERIPYILSILLIIKILFFKKYEKITLFILFLIFIASAVLAFYHFGIEQGFFSESFVCKVGDLSGTLSKEQLLEQLNKNSISCKDVSFRVLGLSLATINTILSIILSVIFFKIIFKLCKKLTKKF